MPAFQAGRQGFESPTGHQETMEVLSLFDGISCGKVALNQLGISCNYYASEIDKHAIQVSKANHPDIIHLCDVKDVDAAELAEDSLTKRHKK